VAFVPPPRNAARALFRVAAEAFATPPVGLVPRGASGATLQYISGGYEVVT